MNVGRAIPQSHNHEIIKQYWMPTSTLYEFEILKQLFKLDSYIDNLVCEKFEQNCHPRNQKRISHTTYHLLFLLIQKNAKAIPYTDHDYLPFLGYKWMLTMKTESKKWTADIMQPVCKLSIQLSHFTINKKGLEAWMYSVILFFISLMYCFLLHLRLIDLMNHRNKNKEYVHLLRCTFSQQTLITIRKSNEIFSCTTYLKSCYRTTIWLLQHCP